MASFLTASAILVSLLLAEGRLGHLGDHLQNLLAFLLLFAIAVWTHTANPGMSRTRRAGSLALTALALVTTARGLLTPELSIGLFLFGTYLALHREPNFRRELHCLMLTLAMYGLFMVAYASTSWVWYAVWKSSVRLSSLSGSLIGQRYAFGPTYSAFFVLVLLLFYLFSRNVVGGTGRRAFPAGVLILLAAYVAFEMLLTPFATLVQRTPRLGDFFLFNPQIFYLAIALGLLQGYLGRKTGVAPDTAGGWKLSALSLGTGYLVAAALLWPGAYEAKSGKVIFYERGAFDWKVPDFSRYGQRAGGMFGLLPGYLSAMGYEVQTFRDRLTPEFLEDCSCFVIINLNAAFTPSEETLLQRYVERGGSILVLAEHTGIGNIRGPSNSLLGPTGIRVNFDSATFFQKGWTNSLEIRPRPPCAGVKTHETKIWVGASLSVRPPARPLIIGKYGYADLGNPADYERAYLGDRLHNPGELLGDVVLVAEQSYGKGKFLVFGDTSTFQNLALTGSYGFVARIFNYLNATEKNPGESGRILLFLGVFLLSLAAVLGGRGTFAAGLLFLAGLWAGGFSAETRARELFRGELPEMDIAWLDQSHDERYNDAAWDDHSVNGLEFNLMRNGLLPLRMREFSAEKLSKAKALVLVAPAKPFSRSETSAIRDFVSSGGFLIVSSGFEELAGSKDLLQTFGFGIGSAPLSQFNAICAGDTVRFDEAWPVQCDLPEAVTLCEKWDYPLAVMKGEGKGAVVVIGDSNFFINRNLEDLDGAYPGNVRFIRSLLEKLRGVSP